MTKYKMSGGFVWLMKFKKETVLFVITYVTISLLMVPCLSSSAITTSVQDSATINGNSLINFDKKVFSWTNRVYITIYAPDFNSDPNAIDVIGETVDDKVNVCTTGHCIPYELVETGVNTGIFSGYVTLTGDPTVKGSTGVDGKGTNPTGIQSSCNQVCGPRDGFLPSSGNDGISVSFEYTRDQTVTGSALIRWHVGEIKWLSPNYPSNGQGILQINDTDMNLDPKVLDKFDVNIWSDSDTGGIKLTMTETGQDTGIFQGTVYFDKNYQSSGNRLHVSDGDSVTGEYIDRTLPPPNSPSDQLRITAITTIGNIVPPLDRVHTNDAKILDSLGNVLNNVLVGQQIQVASDVTNTQDRAQPFAYIVQTQDSNGITLSLSWITGTLAPNQDLSLTQSWSPIKPGSFTAQIFVWRGITSPDALGPPTTLKIDVSK